jgi:hypothetical protein
LPKHDRSSDVVQVVEQDDESSIELERAKGCDLTLASLARVSLDHDARAGVKPVGAI